MKGQSTFLCLVVVFIGSLSSQSITTSYKNGIAIGIPLPGLAVVDLEHFFGDYTSRRVWSSGLSLGYGYDAGALELDFIKTEVDLIDPEPSFDVPWSLAINPYVRYYLGNPDKNWRPALMFKPSLVIFNIENEETYTFPSYEFHCMGTLTFGKSKRLYFNISLGFKHFIKKSTIDYKGEIVEFPAFRFDENNLDEKPKTILPATDIFIGYRF